MIDMLEKLINEHGSSAILRERLELFSDKYSMLEEKNEHLTERNKELGIKLEQAEAQISKLKEQLNSYQINNSTEKINENELNILKLLFDTNTELFAAHVSQHFNMPIGNAEYHLNNLLEKELIYAGYSAIEDTRYKINSDGRKYIIENT
jgi:Na+/phosphate symporter